MAYNQNGTIKEDYSIASSSAPRFDAYGFECAQCQLGLINIYQLPVLALCNPIFIQARESRSPIQLQFNIDNDLYRFIQYTQRHDYQQPKFNKPLSSSSKYALNLFRGNGCGYTEDDLNLYDSTFQIEIRGIKLKTIKNSREENLYSNAWPQDVHI